MRKCWSELLVWNLLENAFPDFSWCWQDLVQLSLPLHCGALSVFSTSPSSSEDHYCLWRLQVLLPLSKKFWISRYKLLKLSRPVCMLSCFTPVWLFVTPWTVAHKSPLFMGFSRQEHWSGLPCPFPGDHPDPGIKPTSPVTLALQADSSENT